MQALILPILLLSADLVVLENDALRLEVDPEVFAIRFVGQPGGPNFVQPVYVPEEVRESTSWCDPGGLVTDLVPYEGRDGALRRGPGEVILREKHRLVLLGPRSGALGLRIKKEFRLARDRPVVTVRTTVLSDQDDPVSYALRNSVRLPHDTTVRVDRDVENFRVLTSQADPGPAVVKSMKYWLVPVPPMTTVEGMVIGAATDMMEIQNDSGVWTRKMVDGPKEMEAVPLKASLLCLLDSPTNSYGAALQSARTAISASRPFTLEERWEFDFRE